MNPAAASIAGRVTALCQRLDGLGAGPSPPAPLPLPVAPLALASLDVWVGCRRVVGSCGASGSAGGGSADDGGMDAVSTLHAGEGLTLTLDAGGRGGDTATGSGVTSAGSGGGDGAAVSVQRIKRPALRGLGTREDFVVGYWRFELRDATDSATPADTPDLTKHGNTGTLVGVDGGTVVLEKCDAPVDHGEEGKVKPPRVLVLGAPGTGPSAKDSAVSAGFAKALRGATLPSWPTRNVVCRWGVVVPVPAWGYFDLGVRPDDTVTASFTLELWAMVGGNVSAIPRAGVIDSDDEDGGSGGGGKASSPPSPPPSVLALRVEPKGKAALAPQWSFVVEEGGVLAFHSHVGGGGSVRSPPGTVEAGKWMHVAAVVDGSSVVRWRWWRRSCSSRALPWLFQLQRRRW